MKPPQLPAGLPAEQSTQPQTGVTAVQQAPDAASTSALANADADKRKEYIEYLEQNKDLTIDGFVELNKQLFLNSEPPKPKLPPVRRNHPEYDRFIDWKRVSYLRTMQHEKIGSMMSAEEKERVKEEGKEILKDRRFIQQVADRTGVYIDLEVQDCIKGYLDTRDHMRRLYRWVVVLGEPEPTTNEMQNEVLREMKALEAEEERMVKLEKQDRNNCPILPVLDFLGHDALCSRTGLKYYECCGGAQGRPVELEGRDKARSEQGLRGRKSPRSEREFRKFLKQKEEGMKWQT